MYSLLIDPILHSLRPRIARCLADRRALRVLDIGCATGAQARVLARERFEVVGVDSSPDMVASAAKRMPSIPFVQASALELPFPQGTFDAAILSLALHEHPEEERTAMVREALRVVHSQGTLVVADFARPKRSSLHIPWQVIRAVEFSAGPEHHAGFADYVRHDALAGLLARLALVADETKRSHFGCISIVAVTKSSAISP